MKQKNTLLRVIVLGLVVIGLVIFFIQLRNRASGPQVEPISIKEKAKPSETLITYTDPAGFEFSYPDNLSISKTEIEDPKVYTDLEVYSKDVSGSIKLKIADTKIATLSAWLKDNGIPESNTPKETKLGNLKALEVKTNDRLMLGALDQGVIFTVEVPLVEEDFWMKVYEKVISGFSFVSAEDAAATGTSNSSCSDVIFEGEEVVE